MKRLSDDLLLDYLDGNLSRQERETIEARLHADPEARQRLSTFRELEGALRATLAGVERVSVSAPRARQGAAQHGPGARRWRGALRPLPIVGVLVALLLGGAFWSQRAPEIRTGNGGSGASATPEAPTAPLLTQTALAQLPAPGELAETKPPSPTQVGTEVPTATSDPTSPPTPTRRPSSTRSPGEPEPSPTFAMGSPEWYDHIELSPGLERVALPPDLGGPRELSSQNLWRYETLAIAANGPFTYVLTSTYGTSYENQTTALGVVDVSTSAAPRLVYSLPLPGNTSHGLEISGNVAFVLDEDGVQVVDLVNPVVPTLAGRLGLPGDRFTIKLAGRYAYIGANSHTRDQLARLHIVDISDPARLIPLGSVSMPASDLSSVEISGTLAYTVDHSGVSVVDVADPAAPALVGRYDVEWAQQIQVVGNRGYLARQGVQILDLSDPARPVLLAEYRSEQLYEASQVEVRGDIAYLTYWNPGSSDYGGLEIVSVADPGKPRLLARATTQAQATDMVLLDDLVYIAHGRHELVVLRLHPDALEP